MFLRFFRSSFFSQYLAIVIAGLLLWARAFIAPPLMPGASGPVPLYQLLHYLLEGIPLFAVILGFFLNLGSAFYLNYLLTKHEILPKNSSLAAFLFLFLVSYYPVLLTVHPANICLLILLIILERLFASYSRSESLELSYSAGFLISIGAMFYFPFIFFYVLIIIAFILFRTSSLREWMSSFIGLCSPFLFLLVYYFWYDVAGARIAGFFHTFRPVMNFEPFRNTGFLVFTSILFTLLVISVVLGLASISERTIEIRRKTILLIWLAVIVLATFPFVGSLLPFHLLISFITVSALISLYFLRLKESIWQEIIMMWLLIFVLVHNFFPFFQ
jgi:hypothetical protein